MQKNTAEHIATVRRMVFVFKLLSVSFRCPYLSSTPGLEVSLERVSSALFSFGLHMPHIGLPPPFLRLHSRGATAHDARSSLQRSTHDHAEVSLSLPRSSPHRICLAVPMAVASPLRIGSSMCGSHRQESSRRSAIQLSNYEWGRIEFENSLYLMVWRNLRPNSPSSPKKFFSC